MEQDSKKKILSRPIKNISLHCSKTSSTNFIPKIELRIKTHMVSLKTLSTFKPPTLLQPVIFIKGNPVESFSPLKLAKTQSTCLLKDASQSKNWLLKAKENIMNELSSFVNASNCLSVEMPIPFFQYKYVLGKGNNSGLIKQCLALRPWWTQVEDDQIFNANFVWTQFKNSEHLTRLPTAYERLKSINHSLLGKSLTLSTLYEDFTSTAKQVDISKLSYDLLTKSKHFIAFTPNLTLDPSTNRIQNKLQHNQNLSDKKFLYRNMKEFYSSKAVDVFDFLPLTFHIAYNSSDYFQFLEYIKQHPNSLWIVKPGENTNRGSGIFVSSDEKKILEEVAEAMKMSCMRSFIVQAYIERPFLINKRKFDMRLYTMVTSVNGVVQAYFYQEGYLRTTSKAYNPADLDNKFIHLTNDAIQNKCEDYGKFECGNKLSYQDFQRYLDNKKIQTNFKDQVLPNIKKIVQDTIKATWKKLNSEQKLLNFEIFGYDFLLDYNLRPWLLEVNTNPCLELSSTNLARIIPAMLENALKIVIDPLFPEPRGLRKSVRIDSLPENKFELIFHSYFME